MIIAGIVEAGGQVTARLIRDAGGEATFVKTAVAQAGDVEALIQAAVDTYGRPDCAHNNAGIEGATAMIADYNESDFDRLIGINLKGVWPCMKYEIIQLRKQGTGGAIVHTSSAPGLSDHQGLYPMGQASTLLLV